MAEQTVALRVRSRSRSRSPRGRGSRGRWAEDLQAVSCCEPSGSGASGGSFSIAWHQRSGRASRGRAGRSDATASDGNGGANPGCAYCLTRFAPLEFGRDMNYCSSACLRASSLGVDALHWDPREVDSWLVRQGLGRWKRALGNLDGRGLFVSVGEGLLQRLGVPIKKAKAVMEAIQDLRQGAWCQPEPPLKDMPLPTVAVKGLAKNPNWYNVLEDPARRSYAALCRGAIDEALSQRWFEALYSGLPWQDLRDTRYQQEGKSIPRRTIFVVSKGCSCIYRYSGVEVAPLEEPDFVAEIRRTCASLAGFTEAEMPNSCNINLYRDGRDSVGWHTDNEPLFEAEYNDACILSLSLGASRMFALKEQLQVAADGVPKEVDLPIHGGDLCTMEGKFQRYYLHAVPKQPRVSAPRINLTWRWITKHSRGADGCSLHGPGN